ncbi:MAG: ATP-dependent helicase [Deltaproteobacteria bacterium]
MNLRSDQAEVCKYREGYMAVPAIPGAGKTYTLAILATNLIKEERHTPGKILIVTYMNSAVSNFKTRIGNMLEKEGLPRSKGYEVMTLHSLAMKILKEKPESILVSGDFEILDELAQDRLLHKLVNEWIGFNEEKFYSFIDYREGESSWQRNRKIETWLKKFTRVVGEMIPFFKCKAFSGCQLLKYTEEDKNSLLRCVSEVYANYEAELAKRGLLDFDDIICKAITLLKTDDELRQRIQNKYTYVFEDEAQDSSTLQEEMLFIISENNKNLVRVGDSNQSIMSSFTISDPKLFRNYCYRDDVSKKKIESSSRNTKEIINMANFLVEWSQELHPTPEARDSLEKQIIKEVGDKDPFPNPKTDGYTIGNRIYDTKEEEIREISKRAAKYANENPKKTIAILVPNNYGIDDFKNQLDILGAKYRELTSFPVERGQASLIIGTVLDYISMPYDNELFYEIIKTCLMPELQDETKFINLRIFLKSCKLEQLLYPLSGQVDFKDIPAEVFEEIPKDSFEDILDKVKLILEGMDVELSAFIIFIADLLNFDSEKMAIAQKIASNIRYMLMLNPDWGIREVAHELKTIKNSLNYFANIVYDRKGFEAVPGEINLLTYHRSKGLEFDTVYLACITSTDFPATLNDRFLSDYWCLRPEYRNPVSFMKYELESLMGEKKEVDPGKQAKIDIIGERMRLLYVGITRARENLLFSAHKEFLHKETGKKIKTAPSLYMEEIGRFVGESRGKKV